MSRYTSTLTSTLTPTKTSIWSVRRTNQGLSLPEQVIISKHYIRATIWQRPGHVQPHAQVASYKEISPIACLMPKGQCMHHPSSICSVCLSQFPSTIRYRPSTEMDILTSSNPPKQVTVHHPKDHTSPPMHVYRKSEPLTSTPTKRVEEKKYRS